jgi:hypothetical protein
MQYVLHIGMNKTGTSTLQVYLYNHRAELQEKGIWYPSLGRSLNAQHDLSRGIKEKDFAKYGIDPAVLTDSGAPEGTQTILICSENFHTVNDVSRVAALFPPSQTKVILYMREHIAYLASWYQQMTQTRNDITCSYYDFARIMGYPFMELVDRWRSVYGANLNVRAYDREKLVGGDIVVDFFSAAFDGKPPSPRQFEDKNPSISGNLLFVKLLLNHFITMEESGAIVEELSSFAVQDKRFTGKIQISEFEAKRIAQLYRDDRHRIREELGIGFKVPREGVEGNPVPDLARLREDIAFFLDTAKSRGFVFYDMFCQKRDFLFPALA